MNRSLLTGLVVMACALPAIGAAPSKTPAPGPLLCVDAVCAPSNPDPRIAKIPPDAPPVVKLRHQLAKERREHRAALAACRAGR